MKKRHPYFLILAVVFVIGLSLLLYPTLSESYNARLQGESIVEYESAVDELEDNGYDDMLAAASEFNSHISERTDLYTLSDKEQREYDSLLRLDDTEVMAYVEIPSIDCKLPIYHGTDDAVLQYGIGHISWSSLPVGGEGTHCIISGHRGLPSARLFTDLDELTEGDLFYIYTLDQTLTYEVDQILIVEPDDTSALMIVNGKDYCTLVTCTPYGVNTHRLLVRGHRVETPEQIEKLYVAADAARIDAAIVAPVLLSPFLLAVLIMILVSDLKKKMESRKSQ